MKALCEFAPLLGRLLIAPLFLWSGYGKIGTFDKLAEGIAAKGLPASTVLAAITIVVEIAGALMILVGWRARLGALALLVWLIPVTLLYHNFWDMSGQQAYLNAIMFYKNLAIMGAMLFVIGFGPGKYSLNNK